MHDGWPTRRRERVQGTRRPAVPRPPRGGHLHLGRTAQVRHRLLFNPRNHDLCQHGREPRPGTVVQHRLVQPPIPAPAPQLVVESPSRVSERPVNSPNRPVAAKILLSPIGNAGSALGIRSLPRVSIWHRAPGRNDGRCRSGACQRYGTYGGRPRHFEMAVSCFNRIGCWRRR
jgi:hypothetical protein